MVSRLEYIRKKLLFLSLSLSFQIDFPRIRAIVRRAFPISTENSFARVCMSYTR